MEANIGVGNDVDAPFALERGEPIRAQDRQQHGIGDVVRLDAAEVDPRAEAAVDEEPLAGGALDALEQRRKLDGRQLGVDLGPAGAAGAATTARRAAAAPLVAGTAVRLLRRLLRLALRLLSRLTCRPRRLRRGAADREGRQQHCESGRKSIASHVGLLGRHIIVERFAGETGALERSAYTTCSRKLESSIVAATFSAIS